MPDLSRPERLQIMLSAEELSALDDWRFVRRMPSRAAAVRELLRLGLLAEGIDLAAPNQTSSSFGVLEGPAAMASSSDGRESGANDSAP
jgi:hypothetical protein